MKRLIIIIVCLLSASAYAQGPIISSGVTSSGPIVGDAGPRWLYEQGADPTNQADRGVIYTKYNAVTGKTDLYYENDVGDVIQITSGGVTPVGQVTWQGITTATYDGNDAGDYDGASDYCRAETINFTGTADSFVCSVADILSIIADDPTVLPATGGAWVNGGPPGFTANANDCLAWSDDASVAAAYGRWWNFADGDEGTGWMAPCDESKAYGCCE